jgi:dolichol-phosphate mannosyltransferase
MSGRLIFLILQLLAGVALLARLGRRPRRPVPLPKRAPRGSGTVTVVIPARNEATRIAPCLAGVMRQGDVVAEIFVVDDESTDGTAEIVRAAGDARVRLIVGRRAPKDWLGKSWALQQALQHVQTEWMLCLDADTRPAPGLTAAALAAACAEGVDALSVAPRFIVDTAGERWLHPALLTTLIYRLGGGPMTPTRRGFVNGQCLLLRAETVRRAGGFAAAAGAFADDFALAAALVRSRARVAFRDGSDFLEVKMYGSAGETWREWGRTLALNEVTKPTRQIYDIGLLALTQAAPLPLAAALAWNLPRADIVSGALLAVNGLLLAIRFAVLASAARCYRPARDFYWLSPLADIAALWRVAFSALQPRREWRGRRYGR